MRKGVRVKTKVLASTFIVFSVAQLGALYSFDRFLRPPRLPAQSTASSSTGNVVPTIAIPQDTLRSVISFDRQHIAYVTKNNRLVLAGPDGINFDQSVGTVVYMQWLSGENTLLYFVQGSYLDARLLQFNKSNPTLVHWYGDRRQVVKTFFSPYLELLYIELQNGSATEVYKYDAVGGMSQLPLGNVSMVHIDYNATTDEMDLTSSYGGVWRYVHGHLYRPDGSRVFQITTSYHSLSNGAKVAATAPNSSSKGGATGALAKGTSAAGVGGQPVGAAAPTRTTTRGTGSTKTSIGTQSGAGVPSTQGPAPKTGVQTPTLNQHSTVPSTGTAGIKRSQ